MWQGLFSMESSCYNLAIEGWMLPLSMLSHIIVSDRNISTAMAVCTMNRNTLIPAVREAWLCVAKCTSLTMYNMIWVMMGRARKSWYDITRHVSYNVGWNSSLLSSTRPDHIGARRAGLSTRSYLRSTSQSLQKLTAGVLVNAPMGEAVCRKQFMVGSNCRGMSRFWNVVARVMSCRGYRDACICLAGEGGGGV